MAANWMQRLDAKLEAKKREAEAKQAEHAARAAELKAEWREQTAGFRAAREAHAAKQAQREADREAAKVYKLEELVLKGDYVHHKRQAYPVAGARAVVEAGAAQTRMTATRIAGGAAAAGAILPVAAPVGALFGAMARKNKGKVFVTVEFADGAVVVQEVPVKREAEARQFAAAVNTRAAHAARGPGAVGDNA